MNTAIDLRRPVTRALKIEREALDFEYAGKPLDLEYHARALDFTATWLARNATPAKRLGDLIGDRIIELDKLARPAPRLRLIACGRR